MAAPTNTGPAERLLSFSMTHCTEVSASPEKAYHLINAVDEWPEFFPPCRAARIVESNGDMILIEVSAQIGEEVRTWRSRRRIDPKKYMVHFEQVDPFPPVASMKGHWRVYAKAREACTVELVHVFETSESVASKAEPARTLYEAASWIRKICDSNSTAELAAFKSRCEANGHSS